MKIHFFSIICEIKFFLARYREATVCYTRVGTLQQRQHATTEAAWYNRCSMLQQRQHATTEAT
jgi:hypothetical protein